MLSRVFSALGLLMCCTGEAASEAVLPAPLTAMTFNIRYGTADDGENSWEHRKDLLIETIRKYDPDVLGLQECLEFQAEYIQEHLPEYRWVGMGRDIGGLGEMTALFYRRERLSVVEMRHFWLSEQPEVPGSVSWDSSLTRMASWFRFYHREAHRMFSVFNTHFDHRGAVARDKSAAALAEAVKELPEEQPVIVMGDFNAAAEVSHPWQLMIQSGLEDTWLSAKDREGPETTWSGFGKAVGREEPFRIDWILTRGPIETEHAEVVTLSKDGRYPSDHFPVVARLHLWEAEPEQPETEPEDAPNPLVRTR